MATIRTCRFCGHDVQLHGAGHGDFRPCDTCGCRKAVDFIAALKELSDLRVRRMRA